VKLAHWQRPLAFAAVFLGCHILNPFEIRMRAERRFGEMMAQQRVTVRLNTGAATRVSEKPASPTLTEAGRPVEIGFSDNPISSKLRFHDRHDSICDIA
jgi:hypothetical protein